MAGISELYNLGLEKFPPFISNGKTTLTVSSQEEVLIDGIGTLDYPAFPSMRIISNVIHLVWKQGSTHNAGIDANINYRTGTITGVDGNGNPSITWGSVTAVIPAVSNYYLTNPSMHVTSTGRIVIFYQRLVPQNRLGFEFDYRLKTGGETGGGQEQWLIYSNNNGSSWSSEIRFSDDYPAPDIMIGTGVAATWKGANYLALHTNAADPYTGRLYKSTDDCLTWTIVETIFPSDGNDFEEPSLFVRSDGLLGCYLRSDQRLTTSMVYRVNGKWSYPFNVFSSKARPGLAFFPSGSIVITGRHGTDLRTVFAHSTDGGKTANIYYADSRTEQHMYGTLQYDSVSSKMIAVYCVISPGGTLTDGPTKMIVKYLSES